MPSSNEDDSEAIASILKIFKRKIAGLRNLSRHERALAFRIACDWLSSEMAGLREKRAYRRHGLRMLRQQRRLQRPTPG
ncbi:hypothetical protein [Bradyrhizobium genosp. A]|uniref:hypothetical protein n=1 Tax=Bradyrhizobium genosp. A TaxID=83626 RepID=UPI003CF347E4